MDSNLADLQRNGCTRKVFELGEMHFRREIECDFRIGVVFPHRDRNRNRDQNHILNHWSQMPITDM